MQGREMRSWAPAEQGVPAIQRTLSRFPHHYSLTSNAGLLVTCEVGRTRQARA